MFVKIKNIEILANFIIRVTFEYDVVKTYDFKPLFAKYPVFEPLKNEALFAKAVIDCGGFGLMWSDDIDIDAAEIWYNGVTTLDTPQDVANYISATVNETDTQLFINALNEIFRVKGIGKLAQKMGVGRESLYKSFDGKTAPKFETVYKALRALNMQIRIEPVNNSVLMK